MPFEIRGEAAFCAGHRLLDYGGKCASPHGHNYRAEVVVAADQLDRLDMLDDFGLIKTTLKQWINENWDHAFLVNSRDRELIEALKTVSASRVCEFAEANPTAETLAATLFKAMDARLTSKVIRVTVWETSLQWASFTSPNASGPEHIPNRSDPYVIDPADPYIVARRTRLSAA
jgi:6-pyruvoyltetrahydropterin/6-carboxytetrahydropterin synthase